VDFRRVSGGYSDFLFINSCFPKYFINKTKLLLGLPLEYTFNIAIMEKQLCTSCVVHTTVEHLCYSIENKCFGRDCSILLEFSQFLDMI
jgi:hypothetical protein